GARLQRKPLVGECLRWHGNRLRVGETPVFPGCAGASGSQVGNVLKKYGLLRQARKAGRPEIRAREFLKSQGKRPESRHGQVTWNRDAMSPLKERSHGGARPDTPR